MRITKNDMLVFWGIFIVLSSVLFIAAIQQDSFVGGSKVLGFLIMWTPGIAAIITLLFCRKGLKIIGWKPGRLKYLLIGFFLPTCYILIVILIGCAFDLIRPLPAKFDSRTILMLVIGPLLNIVATIGEEIGWRGFLLPRLYGKYRFAKTSLIIGAIWAVWHFPLMIFTDMYSGQYLWLALAGFTVYTICITFAYNWLWLASGSIWTVSLLHSANNVYAMSIDRLFEAVNPGAELIVFDFGIGVPLLSIPIAFLFWKLRKKLPDKRFFPVLSGDSA